MVGLHSATLFPVNLTKAVDLLGIEKKFSVSERFNLGSCVRGISLTEAWMAFSCIVLRKLGMFPCIVT